MDTSETKPDYALSVQAQAGCKASLEAVLSIVSDLRASEDARSRLAVRLMSGKPVLAGYRGAGSLESYLLRCATNEARQEVRTMARRERLLREASAESHFTRRSSSGASTIEDRRVQVSERLLEPCISMHLAHGAVGRPRKLLTAAESGLFRTLAGLCRMHEALLEGKCPKQVQAPHASFKPLLELYEEAGGARHLVEVGAASLVEVIGHVETAVKGSPQRDQCKLRESYAHLRRRCERLAARLLAA